MNDSERRSLLPSWIDEPWVSPALRAAYNVFGMATSGQITVDESATIDKRLDTNTLSRSAATVHRENICIADETGVEAFARVLTTMPAVADGAVITQPKYLNRTASGALGAVEDAVTLDAQGIGSASWEIDTGTLVGTVVFEATDDDTNWFAIDAIHIDGTIVTSITSFADRGNFTSTSYSQIRLRVSAFTSGTSNARIEASPAANVVRLGDSLPAGSALIGTVDIGTFPDNEPFDLNRIAGTGISVNTGTRDAGTQRVTIATDDLIDISDRANRDMGLIDIVAALPIGANRIGKVTIRNAADAADIDPLAEATFTGRINTQGQKTMAASTPVVIASDQSAVEIAGDIAHDTGVGSLNPVVGGAEARTTSPTAVASADVVRLIADTLGKQIVLPFANPENFVEGSATLTGTSDVSIIAAAGASIRNYVTEASGSNTSGTNVRVDVKDNVTIKRSFFLAANGGGFVWSGGNFVFRGSANVAVQMALSAAVTDVRVGASGYTAP